MYVFLHDNCVSFTLFFFSLSLSLLASFPPPFLLSPLLFLCTSQGELADPWILPVIQGYVEVRQIPVLCHETPDVLQAGGKRGQEERGRRGEATNLKSKSGPPMGWGSYEMVEMVKGQLSGVEIGIVPLVTQLKFIPGLTSTVSLIPSPPPSLPSSTVSLVPRPPPSLPSSTLCTNDRELGGRGGGVIISCGALQVLGYLRN